MVTAITRPALELYDQAGGFIRVLQQHIGNDRKRERYAPERKEPDRPTRGAADKTGRAIGTRKVKRLQKREQAAEYIAACESQKGTLRLDRKLSKQKNRRNEIGKENYGLSNRKKSVDTR